jgi:hypothetical protein
MEARIATSTASFNQSIDQLKQISERSKSTDAILARIARIQASWAPAEQVVQEGMERRRDSFARQVEETTQVLSHLSGVKAFGLTSSTAAHHDMKPGTTTTMEDAHKVFDAWSTQQEVTMSNIIHVSVSHTIYPVTEVVLRQVFEMYGYGVTMMAVFQGRGWVEASVQLQSGHEAVRARDALHGKNIYDGCCNLSIKCMPVCNLPVASLPTVVPNMISTTSTRVAAPMSPTTIVNTPAVVLSKPSQFPEAPVMTMAATATPSSTIAAPTSSTLVLDAHLAITQTQHAAASMECIADASALNSSNVFPSVIPTKCSTPGLGPNIDDMVTKATAAAVKSTPLVAASTLDVPMLMTDKTVTTYGQETMMYLGARKVFAEIPMSTSTPVLVIKKLLKCSTASLRHHVSSNIHMLMDKLPPWRRSGFSPGSFEQPHLERIPSWRHESFSPSVHVFAFQFDTYSVEWSTSCKCKCIFNVTKGVWCMQQKSFRFSPVDMFQNLHPSTNIHNYRGSVCMIVVEFTADKQHTFGGNSQCAVQLHNLYLGTNIPIYKGSVCMFGFSIPRVCHVPLLDGLPWNPGGHIYVENAQLYTLAHELVGIVRHYGSSIWFSSNEIYVHPYAYAVAKSEFHGIACISVSTCLGDSGLLEIAFDSTSFQLGVSVITCFPYHGLLKKGNGSRYRAGHWVHDFLIRRSLLFLQVPWDPGGMHSRVLRASHVSRGGECNATPTYWATGQWAMSRGPYGLGQTVTNSTKGKE